MISNIVINIKKESGGNNAMLIGDFALETSENIFFSEIIFLTLSNLNGCSSVICCPIPTNHIPF